MTLVQLPLPIIELICQLLVVEVSDVYDYCFCAGVRYLLSLRATCKRMSEMVQQSRTEFSLRLKDWNLIVDQSETWILLQVINEKFHWRCSQITLDVPGEPEGERALDRIDKCFKEFTDIFADKLKAININVRSGVSWSQFAKTAQILDQMVLPNTCVSLKISKCLDGLLHVALPERFANSVDIIILLVPENAYTMLRLKLTSRRFGFILGGYEMEKQYRRRVINMPLDFVESDGTAEGVQNTDILAVGDELKNNLMNHTYWRFKNLKYYEIIITSEFADSGRN